METEITSAPESLVAAAVAIGAVCAIAATLILFPLIDRFIRPRFRLERGTALLVLLLLALFVGFLGGGAFLLLREEPEAAETAHAPVSGVTPASRAPFPDANAEREAVLTTKVR